MYIRNETFLINKLLITTCLLIFLGYSKLSFGGEVGKNTFPINIPTKQLKFEDYPAPSTYAGEPANLLLDSELARTFRTRLTIALSEDPVYAGEYIRTGWGCGSSGCYYEVLVNKRTGKAIETNFSAYNIWNAKDSSDIRVGEWINTVKIDSRLLTTTEVQESNDGKSLTSFTKFYLINDDKLELVKVVQDK